MGKLAAKECIPCRGGIPPLTGNALHSLHAELGGGWQLIDGHHLEKSYRCADFVEALAFTNRVGALAEEVDHHPEICCTWGRVKITIYTHKIDGLAEADFIWAAKADQLAAGDDSAAG